MPPAITMQPCSVDLLSPACRIGRIDDAAVADVQVADLAVDAVRRIERARAACQQAWCVMRSRSSNRRRAPTRRSAARRRTAAAAAAARRRRCGTGGRPTPMPGVETGMNTVPRRAARRGERRMAEHDARQVGGRRRQLRPEARHPQQRVDRAVGQQARAYRTAAARAPGRRAPARVRSGSPDSQVNTWLRRRGAVAAAERERCGAGAAVQLVDQAVQRFDDQRAVRRQGAGLPDQHCVARGRKLARELRSTPAVRRWTTRPRHAAC